MAVNETAAYADLSAVAMLRADNDEEWREGSAEPEVARLLAALLRANATRNALEVGCFDGYTSRRLIDALSTLPWETSLTLCEIDPVRAEALKERIGIRRNVKVVIANSLDLIPTLPAESLDFVWLDGNHEAQHVLFELHALLSRMAPGGIIAGHDVFGVCQLERVFAHVASQCGWRSMSLDLPRLGPAGGIGLLQRPR